MKRKNLRFRINVAIMAACLMIATVFGLIFYSLETHRRQDRLEQVQVLLSAVFEQKREELANEIFARQEQALAMTLNDMRKVKGIVALQVFSLEGQLLKNAGPVQYVNLPETLRAQLDRSPTFVYSSSARPPQVEYATAVEVIGERVGYCSLFFDLSDIQQASRRQIGLILAVFASMLVTITAVLHLLLTRAVIRPVSKLRQAMGSVMDGQLGKQVDLVTGDEIGDVAAAFNAMSRQLKDQHGHLVDSMKARDAYAQQLEESNRKLERLNASLESIVEERTRELRYSYEQLQKETVERQKADLEKKSLEEQLARSQKMEALGLLAGGVAHDLNNVLSGIVSYPDLILMQLPEDSPLATMVVTIQKSGQKAAAIVQDLLTLARRGVTNTEVLSINDDVISDYLSSPEYAKLSTFHRGVDFETHLAEDIMNIRGSSIHLKTALMNLVSNAAEAQPDGGRIIISTENRYVDRPLSGYDHVYEGDYVVLGVQDFGMGIEAEDMDRIFEPFYTKKVMGRSGTGLGMAVVWGTVQDHNGYINVNSTPGKGSLFELYFPVTRETPPQAKIQPISTDDYMGRGERVLVVDDVAEQRDIATDILTKLNYEVVSEKSGEDAVAYLRGHQVDIVVLDMIMDPGMDGLDTYRRILEIMPGQKTIIASGFAENERVKSAQQLGAGEYLRKPYTMEKIGLALRRELAR